LFRRFIAAAALLIVVSGFSRTVAAQQPPWFATWQQVPPARKWFDPWPYQKVTLRIEASDDGLRVIYDMVRRRGGIQHMEWSGRFDGKDYAVQGVDYVLTNAYRKLSDRSYEIVVKVDGRAAAGRDSGGITRRWNTERRYEGTGRERPDGHDDSQIPEAVNGRLASSSPAAPATTAARATSATATTAAARRASTTVATSTSVAPGSEPSAGVARRGRG
jgi:hypothetical protein